MSKKTLISNKLKALDEIVNKFEKEDVDLDDGIEQYKQAVELIKGIEKELNQSELELKEIRSQLE